ncbi:hypothetical protein PVAND_006327 [Polypedilum vanderplanki]|uniref:C2H2-type domain-containing protein n=1 Tax=Polypedilum vanderplanki TaxID=319348 RepID=A0A9J6C3Q6_POLVA|nr:hypothetical protein PVAND_006327 [Polypedilum vanderplanki]
MENDYKTWCRLCGSLESLDKEIDENLIKTIQILLPQIPLSIKICITCKNQLQNINLFITKVQVVDKMFIGLDDEEPEDLTKERLNAYRNYFKLSTLNEPKIITNDDIIEMIEDVQEENSEEQVIMYEDDGIAEEFILDADGQEEVQEEPPNIDFSIWNFKCHLCDQKPYENMALLSKHCRLEHDASPSVKCCSNDCEKMLGSWKRLLIHKEKHFPSYNKLVCQVCTVTLHSKAGFEKHMKMHKDCYICIYCAKQFKDKNSLASHEKTHEAPLEERKQFQCDICNAKFITKQIVSNHMQQRHIQEKNSICPIKNCEKTFLSRKAMKEHQRVHKEKTFACHYCFYIGRTKSNFNRHLKTHARSFQCVKCLKFFDNKIKLLKHKQCKNK